MRRSGRGDRRKSPISANPSNGASRERTDDDFGSAERTAGSATASCNGAPHFRYNSSSGYSNHSSPCHAAVSYSTSYNGTSSATGNQTGRVVVWNRTGRDSAGPG